MHIYEGKVVSGAEFFSLLEESEDFCVMLGRVVLAAGRLEALICEVVESEKTNVDLNYATLGKLISHVRDSSVLKDLAMSLDMLKTQRNYLTHNIYQLLSDRIPQTILEREGLLDSDVTTYIGRARELADNLNHLSDIVARRRRRDQV